MNGDDREQQIRQLLPMVRQVARRVLRVIPAASLDDLIGDGSIGLIRAVDTFDPERGVSLEGYARKVVVGTMLNGLRRMDPISERIRRRIRRAEEARLALAQEREGMPTMIEMERRMDGLRHARTVVYRHTTLSLDAPLPPDEFAPFDLDADPAMAVLRASMAREVYEAVLLLPPRQRKIVAMHYYQKVSLHAISSQMDVTPQRVSQLHLNALSKLRSTIAQA